MIIKPYTPRTESNPRLAAGIRAERQMAHYLDRHFRDSERFLVLHDLRIEHGGEVAQMDHLVVHTFGVIIVESKSVSTSVRITRTGEWERRAPRGWTGMPDPLLQAERQGIVLKRLLAARTEDLLDKQLFGMLQGTFANMALDVFAAISDQGTIQRARKDQAPHAMKADAIPHAIERLVDGYRRTMNPLASGLRAQIDAPRDFHQREMLRIAHFLRVQHAPRGASVPPSNGEAPASGTPRHDVRNATPSPPKSRKRSGETDQPSARQPVATEAKALRPPTNSDGATSTTTTLRLTCCHCGSHDLDSRIGRYGPYGLCRACGRNTAARAACPTCSAKVYLKRASFGFAGKCEKCGAGVEVHLAASS
jgi:hypothetical protein